MSQAGNLNTVTIPFPPGDIPIIFQADSGTATANTNILNVFGGAGTTTSASGNTITIVTSSSGFTWNVVTSATNPNQIVSENGYITEGSSLVTFLPPLSPTIGNSFKILSGTSLFQIIPNGAQNLIIGAVTGFTGATGTATSNSPGDGITMTYIGGNAFQSDPPQGTITLVYA